MDAVGMTSEGSLGLLNVADPDPREGSVLVATQQVGICATDREIARTGTVYACPTPDDFLILGHEAVGRVVDVPIDSAGLTQGDMVVPVDYLQCPPVGNSTCAVDLCPYGKDRRRGINYHGFFRPFFRENPEYLVKVDAGLEDVAMLLEPLTVTLKAFGEAATLRARWRDLPCAYRPEDSRERVMIIGAGPIGMLGIMTARSYGWQTVGMDIVSPDSEKARLVTAVGATYVNALEISPEELARDMPPFDIIVEAVQDPKALVRYVDLLGINGVFATIGWTARDEQVDINIAAFIRGLLDKQAAVIASTGAAARHYWAGMDRLRVINESYPGVLKRAVTGRFAYREFEQAFANGGPDEVKTALVFGAS